MVTSGVFWNKSTKTHCCYLKILHNVLEVFCTYGYIESKFGLIFANSYGRAQTVLSSISHWEYGIEFLPFSPEKLFILHKVMKYHTLDLIVRLSIWNYFWIEQPLHTLLRHKNTIKHKTIRIMLILIAKDSN